MEDPLALEYCHLKLLPPPRKRGSRKTHSTVLVKSFHHGFPFSISSIFPRSIPFFDGLLAGKSGIEIIDYFKID